MITNDVNITNVIIFFIRLAFPESFIPQDGDFVLRRSCPRLSPPGRYAPPPPPQCDRVPLYEHFPSYVDLASEVWGMTRRSKVEPPEVTAPSKGMHMRTPLDHILSV